MANETNAIFALYRRRKRAEEAKKLLIAAGFADNQICLYLPPDEGAKNFHENVRTSWRTGAIIGAAVGASAFLLVGLALSLNLIHLPGHFEASIPVLVRIVLIFVVAALGGLAGAAAGTLVGFGTPESAAPRFASYVQAGGTIVSVATTNGNDLAKARIILDRSGGHDITEMNEKNGWQMIHEQLYERSKNYEPELLNDQNP